MYKSEVRNSGSPWKEFTLDMFTLCTNEEDQEIKIDFFKSSSDGNHKNLGSTSLTITELKNGNRRCDIKGKRSSSTLEIKKFEIVRSCNFLEYVFGGCQINLSVAIDFTLSNGPPTEYDSLHCNDPRRNQYM